MSGQLHTSEETPPAFPCKARIIPTPGYTNWTYSRDGKYQVFHAGDEITIIGADFNLYYQFTDPLNSGQYFSIRKTHVELIDEGVKKHKCHCPRENFRWNGPNCTCGGE
jgi:hypothetical protein